MGYAFNTPKGRTLSEAQDSLKPFLAKVLSGLRQKMGERYFMHASEGNGSIFYFFSPNHPIDSFSLILRVRDPVDNPKQVSLSFGYMPYKSSGAPDFKNSVEERISAEAETAGLAFMKLFRDVLRRIR